MSVKQAAKLEKLAKEDMEQRKKDFVGALQAGKDDSYDTWLAKEQKEARIIEENL